MCLHESITKQFMFAPKLQWTGCAPTLFCLGIHVCFFIMFNQCLNFMQHRSTDNIVQFPFETYPNFLFAGKTSRSFDKALQMKHRVHVLTNRTQINIEIHIRHLKCSNVLSIIRKVSILMPSPNLFSNQGNTLNFLCRLVI